MFRAGEQGRFWYAVLGGSLEVRYHAADTDNSNKVYLIVYICISLSWVRNKSIICSQITQIRTRTDKTK